MFIMQMYAYLLKMHCIVKVLEETFYLCKQLGSVTVSFQQFVYSPLCLGR